MENKGCAFNNRRSNTEIMRIEIDCAVYIVLYILQWCSNKSFFY